MAYQYVNNDDIKPLFDYMDAEDENINNAEFEGSKPLYDGSSVTLDQSMMLILTFAFKHGLTGQCLSDLLTLISLHCLTPNICKTSLNLFRKHFSNIRIPLIFHKYCSGCFYNLEALQQSYTICNSDLAEAKAVSYFVEIPLDHQFQKLFKREQFHKDLCHCFDRFKKCSDRIEDIYDGNLYQEFFQADGLLTNHNNISLMWYTDGVAIFKSSMFGIWPLFFAINELQYEKRMKPENILFGRLWFGEAKPSMGTFLWRIMVW